MAKVTFITGGQRSGKSSYAQKLAEEKAENPVYLATSRIWDADFGKRVERHKQDRGDHWVNVEVEKYVSKHNFGEKVVLLDCITLWLTNFYHDNNCEVDITLKEAKAEWQNFIVQEMDLIVVSNELGMGVHPENEIARKFADLQGWMNQYIAKNAETVILMVSGIPIKIK